MPYESEIRAIARQMKAEHGPVTQIEGGPDDKPIITFEDGHVLHVPDHTGGVDVSLLTYGYAGTGPDCFHKFLVAAGFEITYEEIKTMSEGEVIARPADVAAAEEPSPAVPDKEPEAAPEPPAPEPAGPREEQLIAASAAGDLAAVEEGLAGGAVINAQDERGETPLTSALRGGHVAVAKLLVERGAAADWTGLLTDKSLLKDPAIVELLIGQGADVNARNERSGLTPLHVAVQAFYYDTVRLLIKHGADVDAPMGDAHDGIRVVKVRGGNTALSDMAAESVHMVKILIEGGANVDVRSRGGFTPLMVAAGRGKTDIVRALIEAGADVDAVAGNGATALGLARSRGYVKTADVIRNRGVEPPPKPKPKPKPAKKPAAKTKPAKKPAAKPKPAKKPAAKPKPAPRKPQPVPGPIVQRPKPAPETPHDRAVREQIRALRNTQVTAAAGRREAAEALGEMGDPRAVPPLVEALRDADILVRDRAEEALGKLKDPSAIEPLMEIMREKRSFLKRLFSDTRERAARVLGEVADASAVEPLIGMLGNRKDPVGQALAAGILGRIGDPRGIAPLAELLTQSKGAASAYARKVAARSLARIDDDRAAEALSQALEHRDVQVLMAVMAALTARGDAEAVRALTGFLDHQYSAIRHGAAQSLGVIGRKEALESLEQATQDKDPLVRRAARQAIDQIQAQASDDQPGG